ARPAAAAQALIFPPGTVLIAGGASPLGQQLARRAAGCPGTRVLLPVTAEAASSPAIGALRDELGSQLAVAVCDLAGRDAARRLLAGLPAGQPLCAVLVVADDQDDLARGQVAVAAHLDELTRQHDLSMFLIACPAGTALGIPGPAGSGPGHSALDAVARRRRAAGRTAVLILPAAVAEPVPPGLRATPPEAVLAGIERRPGIADDPLVLADICWDDFIPGLAEPARRLFQAVPAARGLAGGERDGGVPDDLVPLTAIPEAERLAALTDRIRRETASVLGHDSPDAIADDDEFPALGLTSFTALELSIRLGLTGADVKPADVFDHLTPAALAAHICDQLAGTGGDAAAAEPDLIREPS
ncbi:MAG TPA: beta-ketoacyl reductase, partial [Streptosporangiaceae bacterium]